MPEKGPETLDQTEAYTENQLINQNPYSCVKYLAYKLIEGGHSEQV